jgi:TRAP-type uncharacterized transport system substrate-binding protein
MDKKLLFAASSTGEPWWVIGTITSRLLAQHGYDVTVLTESAAQENPRYVGGGKAHLGASTPATIGWALRGEHGYQGETFADLRAVARIRRPSWLAVAARYELGFTDLRSLAESDYPLRVLTHELDSTASVVPRRVLQHYGLSPDQLAKRGGRVDHLSVGAIREGDWDLIISNVYLGRTAVTRYWIDASVLFNLRFYDLDDDLLDALVAEGHGTRGDLPFHILRGVDRDIRTLDRRDGILVYLPADTDEDFVYQLAKLYDANREAFFKSAVHMAYDPAVVTNTDPLELHPGARRYYQQAGHLPA